ncbi:MAG: cytochrome c maturation protein CcmE [Actinomycetota bacterium]|nr:cytochrome c maturation protein CcmE [Actinomycetota bacterium]
MKPHYRFIIAAAVVAAAIASLIWWGLSGSTAYYRTPAELNAGPTPTNERVRVAGKVVAGSVDTNGGTTDFRVTDGKAEVAVTTRDVLPDTFGAGVEVVAEGAMGPDRVFSASSVLAKCPSKFKARVSAKP